MNVGVGLSRMTILKEPLVHFLLLGAVIFGLYAALDDSPPSVARNAIDISVEDAQRLVAEFEATWRRPPSETELAEIIDATRITIRTGTDMNLHRISPKKICVGSHHDRATLRPLNLDPSWNGF